MHPPLRICQNGQTTSKTSCLMVNQPFFMWEMDYIRISGFTHVLYCNPSVCWWKISTFADKNPPLLLLKSPTVPPLSVWSKWLNGLQHGHTPARFHHLLRGCQALCVARKLQMANLTCFFTLSFNMLKHLRRASVLRFPRRRTLNPKTLNHPKP